MDKSEILGRLRDVLPAWYEQNRRSLPWREDRDPYKIWISEIMLQQTRVEAVKGYYARFLEAFPTVEALADAPDDKLHKLWEGLGYYSRVRNLKKAAQVIVREYKGEFPRVHGQILALPGIGPYTAGAICSIAYDLPTPAVDGNVLRVVSRLCNDDTPINTPACVRAVQKALEEIYPAQAGVFTQALMELGATVCGPNRKPECEKCPCSEFCMAYALGTADSLPVKLPKAQRRTENKTVFILRCDDRFALCKRPDKGLLAGLWEFPNVSGHLAVGEAIGHVEQMGAIPVDISKLVEKKHIFTHIEWHMRGVYMRVRCRCPQFSWLTADEINTQAALPTAFRQFWEDEEIV